MGVTCAGAADVKEDVGFRVDVGFSGRKGDSRLTSTPFTLLGVRGISEGVDGAAKLSRSQYVLRTLASDCTNENIACNIGRWRGLKVGMHYYYHYLYH